MKTIVLISIIMLCVVGAMAQEPETTGLAGGMAYSQNSTPAVTGWAAFDKQIDGKLYSYSGTQIFPTLQDGKPQLEFKAFTGLAFELINVGKFSFFTQGAGGIDATAKSVTGMGNFGGFVHYKIKGRWGLIGGVQGAFSPLNGRDAIIYYGGRYGLK
jgi:hypothetical protein